MSEPTNFDTVMLKCGYCGNYHTYSAAMCKDMAINKIGFTHLTTYAPCDGCAKLRAAETRADEAEAALRADGYKRDIALERARVAEEESKAACLALAEERADRISAEERAEKDTELLEWYPKRCNWYQEEIQRIEAERDLYKSMMEGREKAQWQAEADRDALREQLNLATISEANAEAEVNDLREELDGRDNWDHITERRKGYSNEQEELADYKAYYDATRAYYAGIATDDGITLAIERIERRQQHGKA